MTSTLSSVQVRGFYAGHCQTLQNFTQISRMGVVSRENIQCRSQNSQAIAETIALTFQVEITL